MPTTACLATTFINVSGGVLRTSLFAPHGAEMPIDGEITILGSPTEIVTRGRSPSHCSRSLKGLEAALVGNLLAIKSTPNPIVYDAGESQMLTFTGGVLTPADPCWSAP